jgi:hypothetical protein
MNHIQTIFAFFYLFVYVLADSVKNHKEQSKQNGKIFFFNLFFFKIAI